MGEHPLLIDIADAVALATGQRPERNEDERVKTANGALRLAAVLKLEWMPGQHATPLDDISPVAGWDQELWDDWRARRAN